jgi:hypothetical protein
VGEPLPGALLDGRVVVQLAPLLRLLGYSSNAVGSAVSKFDQSLAKWVDGGCEYSDLSTCKAAISPRLRLAKESQRDARFVSKEGFKWIIKVLNEWEPKRQPLATVADSRCRRKIREALFTIPPAVAVTMSSPEPSSVASSVSAAAAAAASPRPAMPLSRSSSNDAQEERKEGPVPPAYSHAHAPLHPFVPAHPPPPAMALLPSFDSHSQIASVGSAAEAASYASSYAAFTAAAAAAASYVAAASSPYVAPAGVPAAVPALPPLAASLALHYAAETLVAHPERVDEVQRIIDYLQSLLPHAAPLPPLPPPPPAAAAASASVAASLDSSLSAPILPPLEFHSHAASPVASVSVPSPASAATAASAASAAPSRPCSTKRHSRPSDAFDSNFSGSAAGTAADDGDDASSHPPPPKRARLLLPPGPLATFEMGQCFRSLKPSGRMYVVQPSSMQLHEQLLPCAARAPDAVDADDFGSAAADASSSAML